MPLITIAARRPAEAATLRALLSTIRTTGAAAFDTPPSNMWAVFQELTDETALLGDNEPLVLVEVKVQAGRTQAQKDRLAQAITKSIASALATAEANVWLHYHEMRPADVWFASRWSG